MRARTFRSCEQTLRSQTKRERRIVMKRPGAWPVTFPIVICLFWSAAMLLQSCAKPYHEENERYVFVATNINLPYWQEANAGFLDAASGLGVKGELRGPATYD